MVAPRPLALLVAALLGGLPLAAPDVSAARMPAALTVAAGREGV